LPAAAGGDQQRLPERLRGLDLVLTERLVALAPKKQVKWLVRREGKGEPQDAATAQRMQPREQEGIAQLGGDPPRNLGHEHRRIARLEKHLPMRLGSDEEVINDFGIGSQRSRRRGLDP